MEETVRVKLFPRVHSSDIVVLALFILKEVQKSGQLHGYNVMHLKCIQKRYVVP